MVSKSQLGCYSVNNVEFVSLAAVVILFAVSGFDAFAETLDEPDRPINLLADDVLPTKIDLSWDAPQNDGGSPITGYKIEFKIVPEDYLVLVGDTGSNSTTYSHVGLQTGKTYIYRVFAINDVGKSEASLEALGKPTASSTPPEQIPPNPPIQLNATDVSPTQIDLSWIKPVDNDGPSITGYMIERKTSTSSYSTLVQNSGTATEYSDTDVITETNYIYRIFAINSVGTGGSSNEASATPTASSSPAPQLIVPNRPTILSVEPVSTSELMILWKEPADNDGPEVTGYKIEVTTDSESYSVIADNTGPVTSFIHTNLNSDTSYTYRISAINSVGTSNPSNVKSGIPQHTLVPTQLVATAVSPTQIDLKWNPPSQTYGQSITGYVIQEKIAFGVYETIENIGKYTEYSITGLETDKTYSFVVFAKYTLGSSDISNEATATPETSSESSSYDTIPDQPINLKAVARSPIQIDLSWDAPSNDGGASVTGYKIEVSINSGNYVTLTKNTDTTTRTFVHTDREPDTMYTYRVYAINSVGTSGSSNEASATPTASNDTPTASNETSFIPTTSLPTPTVPSASINPESVKTAEPKETDPTKRIPGFPDPEKDPQYYVDRYNNEESYKKWFDSNFPDYTIYEVVGSPEPSANETSEDNIFTQFIKQIFSWFKF